MKDLDLGPITGKAYPGSGGPRAPTHKGVMSDAVLLCIHPFSLAYNLSVIFF